MIYADSPAAIGSLTNVIWMSVVVHECRKLANEISSYLRVIISCISGYRDIVRKYIENELARVRTEFTFFDVLQGKGVSIALARLGIVQLFNVKAQYWWNWVTIHGTITIITGNYPLCSPCGKAGLLQKCYSNLDPSLLWSGPPFNPN